MTRLSPTRGAAGLFIATGLFTIFGCQTLETRQRNAAIDDLDRRYEAMREASQEFGEGGLLVLETAYRVLRDGRAAERWPLVGLEDLWVEAIQEGRGLFNDPDKRWGRTTALETKDMLGQTTIGPWQITIDNVRDKYGLAYGVWPTWSEREVYEYCRDHPEVQVKMICDYIQESYEQYGRRSPHGIQRYFWLEGYLRGWIGQGRWDDSVLPKPPNGDWKQLTPAMKAATGFYAKQIVCGWRGNSRGLLYWLWVTQSTGEIEDLLKIWRDQTLMLWDERRRVAVRTDVEAVYDIEPADLKYLLAHPQAYADVLPLVERSVGRN